MYEQYDNMSIESWKAEFDGEAEFVVKGSVIEAIVNMMGCDTVMGEYNTDTGICTLYE